jgi:hypothetical protein
VLAAWTPEQITNLVMQITALLAGLTAFYRTVTQDRKHTETRKDVEANRDQLRDVKDQIRTSQADIKQILHAAAPPAIPISPVNFREMLEQERKGEQS